MPSIVEITNSNTEICTSQKSSTTFLEQTDIPVGLIKKYTQTCYKVTLISPFQATGFSEQHVWQIK